MSYYNCYGRNGFGCNSCSNINSANTYGCSGGRNGGCANTANVCQSAIRPHYPFPPVGSVCGTCPPGTRPCNSFWNPCTNGCGCGCGGSCGCGGCGCGGCGGCGCGDNNGDNQGNAGTYAFFNSTGSTLTTGSIIPLRYVIGSGELGRGTTGGTVSLDDGVYSVEYSLNATSDVAGSTITITPEYLGALHPEYSRSFTTSDAGQTFDIAGSFVVNLPTDTTLSLNVTITPPGTETVTLTDVNASMLIRRISGNDN